MIYIFNANKRFFYAAIAALSHELTKLGYPNNPVEQIPETEGDKVDTIIVFGYQDVSGKKEKTAKLFKFNLIIYNTEQLINKNSLVRDLINADHVWDYSFENIKLLKNKSVYHVPLGYSDSFVIAHKKPNRESTKLNYFGTTNQRRRKFIQKLREAELPIVKNDNMFFGRYDRLLRENSTYINIHHFDRALLEIFRIVPLLCNDCKVYSERSKDTKLDNMFEPYITFFSDVDDLKTKLSSQSVELETLNPRNFKTEIVFEEIIKNSGCLKCFETVKSKE